MQPLQIATVKTDLFEHRHVRSHFINPCCFGEDFAMWLKSKLLDFTEAGFTISEPVQEDYGWGLWIGHDNGRYWIALSYVGTGPTELPAQWVISITPSSRGNFLKRLFAKADSSVLDRLHSRIRKALEETQGIRIVESPGGT
jgi:hypothetical protein